MLRFYRVFMEQVLMALIYARELEGSSGRSFDNVREYCSRWRTFNPGQYPNQTQAASDVMRVIFDSNDMEKNLTEIIDDLIEQVRASHMLKGGSSSDKDLIDTMVRILQLPYSRNRLSGDSLEALR